MRPQAYIPGIHVYMEDWSGDDNATEPIAVSTHQLMNFEDTSAGESDLAKLTLRVATVNSYTNPKLAGLVLAGPAELDKTHKR